MMRSILFLFFPLMMGSQNTVQVLGSAHTTLELGQPDGGVSALLIGGENVEPGNFPGVFYTRQGNSRCTGTLVGDRVVATAAHCVSNGGSLRLTYQDKSYQGRCTRSRHYSSNATADWALCLLEEPVTDPIAESINTDADRLAIGDEILLMGYGCTRQGGGGGNDSVLRANPAKIVSLPSGRDHDIVTRGDAALCYGDSGGPSFWVDQETGQRFQTGINSRGNISDTSYLSSLHTDEAVDFYQRWADDNGVRICGMHDDASSCLQTEDTLPEECKLVRSEGALLHLTKCALAQTPPDQASCEESREQVMQCLDARQGN